MVLFTILFSAFYYNFGNLLATFDAMQLDPLEYYRFVS